MDVVAGRQDDCCIAAFGGGEGPVQLSKKFLKCLLTTF